jgi:ubiquinone/menaquinone biosynthesis C-methylase UbiE
MDDKTFDQQTALDWINSIETEGKSHRDDDIYPMLDTWIKRASPLSVLDIGCGQGICSDKIDLNDRSYTGVEPSSVLLNRAKQLYPLEHRNFLLGNAYLLPLLDNSFDAAFSILVWHLLSDLRLAAHELSRVLNKRGNFLIITANPAAYSAWKGLYSDLKLTGQRLEGTMQLGGAKSHDVLHLHTFDEIQDSLQNAGLLVEEVQTFRPSKQDEGQKMLISIQGKKV